MSYILTIFNNLEKVR